MTQIFDTFVKFDGFAGTLSRMSVHNSKLLLNKGKNGFKMESKIILLFIFSLYLYHLVISFLLILSLDIMLAFVTSLKHPSCIESYPRMARLLERTLQTLFAQTRKDFKIIIVCHEIPKLSREYPEIDFILVDYQPPGGAIRNHFDLVSVRENLEMVKLDKGRKYLHALYHLRPLKPSHVMFFDADDCLAPTLAETVLSGSKNASWYVGEGYIYAEGSHCIVHRKSDFHTHCGTCYIFNYGLFDDLPKNMESVDVSWIKKNLGSHRDVNEFLAEKHVTLKKIPYPAVTYIIGSQENHSGIGGYGVWASRRGGVVRFFRLLRQLPHFRWLTKNIKDTFLL